MVEEHWNKLAEITLNEYPNINIASMDCSGAGKETCKKFDIKGYPVSWCFFWVDILVNA